MANYTADQLTPGTDANSVVFAGAPFGGGNSQGFLAVQVLSAAMIAGAGKLPVNSVGAGFDIVLGGGDAGATGRGGHVLLQPGAQLTSGGDGQVQILNSAGTVVMTIDGAGKILFSTALNAGLSQAGLGIMGVTNATTGGGSMAYARGAVNTTMTGTNHNLALDASGFQRLSGSSTPVITGMAPPSGGSHVDGNARILFNIGATAIQFNHNDSNSSAANRFYAASGANVTVSQNQRVSLHYDATDNGSGSAGWRISPAS